MIGDQRNILPIKLLANRLALKAALATSKLEGRLAREADIRDAFHLTPPGAARGPDGDLLAFWRDGGRLRPRRTRAIGDLVGVEYAGEMGVWLNAGQEHSGSRGHWRVAWRSYALCLALMIGQSGSLACSRTLS